MLDQIIQHKQTELKKLLAEQRDFVYSLQQHRPCAVIAEYKRASPSEGAINTDVTVEQVVEQYAAGGAAAVSIVTDQRFFQGHIDFIRRARAACDLPILRKDFIVDPLQVYESKLAGADAILLIARVLSEQQLGQLTELAHTLQLQVLVEIHSLQELSKALSAQPDMLGINARNLQTMTTDLAQVERIIAAVPKNMVVVAESGIITRAEVVALQRAGAQAVLVGTHVMRSANQKQAVEALAL